MLIRDNTAAVAMFEFFLDAALAKEWEKLSNEKLLVAAGSFSGPDAAVRARSYFSALAAILPRLAGRDLGCWCALNSRHRCHADVLLDRANCHEGRPPRLEQRQLI